MRCACIYSGYDGESEEIAEYRRKARKQHECYECGATIQPGETYTKEVVKTDRRIENFKTCDVCRDVRDTLFCDGWLYGEVWDALRKAIKDGWEPTEGCLEKLSPEAREKVIAFFDECMGGEG